MEYKITVNNENETLHIAENIESEKFPNMIICLEGELGSGKTLFTKGIASALGIEDTVTSPTFTMIKEYLGGEMPLFHVDAYRIENDENDLNGLQEYFNKDGIVVIEWADLVGEILPEERLDIEIKVLGEEKRMLVITPHGQKYEELCESVL